VDYPREILNAAVQLGYLPKKEAFSKAEIRKALSAMLVSILDHDKK
jgi:hypothetical protein